MMTFPRCIISKTAHGDTTCAQTLKYYNNAITFSNSFNSNSSARLFNELPLVILEHICSYMDHKALHAVEETSILLRKSIWRADLWKRLLLTTTVVTANLYECDYSWKTMGCLSLYRHGEENLLKGVQDYSSADRPSESPQNTLVPSRCWSEIMKFQGEALLDISRAFHGIPSFAMTLGERIQMKCGCSTGNSCYWSSSASLDKNAQEYIDYRLNGPCVMRCVQIVPYRVFWHPGSPTYAPRQVYFEFYEYNDGEGKENIIQPDRLSSTIFYRSPKYAVYNEMRLQEFELPCKVWASNSTILRIHFIGRHQAQTFELPQRIQLTLNFEDTLPKYYVCLSYVNALGISHKSLQAPKRAAQSSNSSSELHLFTTTLTHRMTACYEGLLERCRANQ